MGVLKKLRRASLSEQLHATRSMMQRTNILVFLLAQWCTTAADAGRACCWSKWGNAASCGNYVGSGGRCNTNWAKSCNGLQDCPVEGVVTRTEIAYVHRVIMDIALLIADVASSGPTAAPTAASAAGEQGWGEDGEPGTRMRMASQG